MIEKGSKHSYPDEDPEERVRVSVVAKARSFMRDGSSSVGKRA